MHNEILVWVDTICLYICIGLHSVLKKGLFEGQMEPKEMIYEVKETLKREHESVSIMLPNFKTR